MVGRVRRYCTAGAIISQGAIVVFSECYHGSMEALYIGSLGVTHATSYYKARNNIIDVCKVRLSICGVIFLRQ